MGFVANEEPGVGALKLSDLRRHTGGFSGLRELFICAAHVILRLKEHVEIWLRLFVKVS